MFKYKDRIAMYHDLFRGAGIEVGVAWGHNANQILANPAVSLLYCVDPWSRPEEEPLDAAHTSTETMYLEAIKFLKPVKDRVEIYRTTAQRAIELFTPGSIDFVYLDGDHRYEAVRWELINYRNLLASGGVLAGHDYCGLCSGVMKAVDEFRREYQHREFILTDEDSVADGHSIRSFAFIF
jgi:hypothetical protein